MRQDTMEWKMKEEIWNGDEIIMYNFLVPFKSPRSASHLSSLPPSSCLEAFAQRGHDLPPLPSVSRVLDWLSRRFRPSVLFLFFSFCFCLRPPIAVPLLYIIVVFYSFIYLFTYLFFLYFSLFFVRTCTITFRLSTCLSNLFLIHIFHYSLSYSPFPFSTNWSPPPPPFSPSTAFSHATLTALARSFQSFLFRMVYASKSAATRRKETQFMHTRWANAFTRANPPA